MHARPWKIGARIVDLSHRGMIMGVLNVTPDSFSDGGEFFAPEKAVEHGLRMATEGADIIDIGGESTRPGAEPVSIDEELRRVVAVIKALSTKTRILISIDTSKSEVAGAALDNGATIVNDITGGRADDKMLPLVAKRNAGLIVMHMQGKPRTMQDAPHYVDVVAEVADFFRQRYERALSCGVDSMAMAFDPGIGFGKTLAHNLALLASLDQLRVHNRPIVIGVSRKSFLAKLTGSTDMHDRLAPTVAMTSLLRARGADIFRVHDVKENLLALRAAEAILEH
jgi:dihydropteroate synthase